MTDIVLRTDKEWSAIDGEACRVKLFTPWANVEDGRVRAPSTTDPYAAIVIECAQLGQDATGFITQKIDFLHLWRAFNERGVGDDEEVIVFWLRSQLKWSARMMARTMPKLWVWICPAQAFEVMSDASFRPELSGQERWEAWAPIVDWKPEVMN